MIIQQERRRSPRFSASYPIDLEGGEGRTTNLSGTGILFETDTRLNEGSLLRLKLHVTPHEGGTMVLVARILRVSRDGGTNHVAARIERVLIVAESPIVAANANAHGTMHEAPSNRF